MRARIKVGGKAGTHVGKPEEGKEVTLSRDKNEVLLSTDMPFSKRCVLCDVHFATLVDLVLLYIKRVDSEMYTDRCLDNL